MSPPGEAWRAEGRTLLVLAASAHQLPVIRRARAMGARVVTADNAPANPGHALADLSRDVDTTDAAGLLALAREVGADGVIAAATDAALLSAARLGEALGLVAPPVRAVSALVPKAGFRRLQDALGLPRPDWSATGLPEGPGPFVVKPNRGSGSRGARVVEHAEAAAARAASAALSPDGSAVVEAWRPGRQHTLEGAVWEGRVVSVLATDRLTADLPHVATRGHRVPSSLPDDALADLVSQVERVFAALGHGSGPFDADAVLAPEGPTLLELTPRAGGNALIALVGAATGHDRAGWLVAHALRLAGAPPPLSPRPAAAAVLGLPGGGAADYDPAAAEALRGEAWCPHLVLDHPPGTPVPPFTDGRARFGEAVVTGESAAEVSARLAELSARLGLPPGAVG